MDILKDIKEDLGKGKDKYLHTGVAYTAQQAGQIAWELQIRHNKNYNAVEDRLRHIKDIIKLQGIPIIHTTKPLWAKI